MRLSKPAWLLHVSLLLIVAGGVLTWLTGDRGQVVLGKGETASVYVTAGGDERVFPFALSLDSFTVDYYPGGMVPRDYVSRLKIDGDPAVVSVNNIVSVKGYRLCQMSYDGAGRTVLGVNHDPAGIGVTYTGYVLFALSGLWLLLSRSGGFRRGLRRLFVCALVAGGCTVTMSAETIAGMSREQADSLSARQVMYNGRLMTFNSLARDFTAKITGGEEYRGLSAEQFMASWLLYPEQWQEERAILIKDERLRARLGIAGRYASLSDLFDADGGYRLQAMYGKGDQELDRAVEEVDEKTGIIMELLSGKLIVARPDDVPPLSEARVAAELIYNRVPFTMLVFVILFAGAAAAFASLFGIGKVRIAAVVLLWTALSLQVVSYGLEWYISGHIPLANTGETMSFMLIVLLVMLLLLYRRSPLLLPAGMLLAGAVALVTHLIGTNPVLTPLMPVLQSPWLSIHVTLVMVAYAFIAITVAGSCVALVSRRQGERMMNLDRVLLYPALYLLGLGIVTGAVWANVSWGRYWAWDPKETWALITFLIYALPMHRSVRMLNRPRIFHVYMLLAFLAVLMTYFGVNSLSSLHSYSR